MSLHVMYLTYTLPYSINYDEGHLNRLKHIHTKLFDMYVFVTITGSIPLLVDY